MGFDFKSERLVQQADYLDRLIEEKVLVPMSSRLFPGEEGTLILTCSDGDQQQHIMMAHWGKCSGRSCHHVIANNGLGLRIAKNSPVARGFEHAMWLDDALLGAKIKELNTITIYGHWPCGVGEKGMLSLDTQFDLYAQAKDELIEFFRQDGRHPEVILGFHIHHGGAKRPFKELYYFDRHQWNNFRMTEEGREHQVAENA